MRDMFLLCQKLSKCNSALQKLVRIKWKRMVDNVDFKHDDEQKVFILLTVARCYLTLLCPYDPPPLCFVDFFFSPFICSLQPTSHLLRLIFVYCQCQNICLVFSFPVSSPPIIYMPELSQFTVSTLDFSLISWHDGLL